MIEFVSVIIPIRNEKEHIQECLDSVLSQSYDPSKIEILIVDGHSDDGTREIVMGYSKKHPNLKLLVNEKRIVPSALNIGIRNSTGSIIVRLDAHTYYDKDYVLNCVKTLRQKNAANVGGRIITLPGADTPAAKAISIATSSVFGVGNSKFRTATKAQFVDTVAFGAFDRKVFEELGLFNERLIRNQDIELNSRIIKNGGRIYLNPEIKAFYYNQSTLKGLWKQNFGNGKWNVFTTLINRNSLSLRHFIPLAFVLSLVASFALGMIFKPFFYLFLIIAGTYMSTNLLVSYFCLKREKDWQLIVLLPMVFIVLHFSYGLGYFMGFLKLRQFRSELGE